MFKKGYIPWNKNKNLSKEIIEKKKIIMKEKWNNPEYRKMMIEKRIGKGMTGKKHSKEAKEKSRLSHLGKKLSDETKRKMSESRKGSKSCNWLGGKSFEPYGLEFNEQLKEVIRNRDRRKCKICEKTELENKEKLTVHHIDYNKKNNNPNNLISLCHKCHSKTNHNREYWINYFK